MRGYSIVMSRIQSSYDWKLKMILLVNFIVNFMIVGCRLLDVFDVSSKLTSYRTAISWQQGLVQRHIAYQDSNCRNSPVGSILVVQHEPVYTLGTGTKEDSGPFSSRDKFDAELNFETIQVNRAGEATFHGPGQLVLYPILDLNYFQKDIDYYLRSLEEVTIRTARTYDLKAYRIRKSGYTGVWVEDHKVAALGLKIQRWVTMHGMSVNVACDMRYFDNIVPCGIRDKAVGNLNQFNSEITFDSVHDKIIENFFQVFDAEVDQFFDYDSSVAHLSSLSIHPAEHNNNGLNH